MPKIVLLARNAEEYGRLLEAARLPGLEIAMTPAPDCELAFGEPGLIRQALPLLPRLKWVQAIWAGVEPLMDPALRRDYVLTNARRVFGPLMSEYVFAYLLLHERKVLQRLENQRKGEWDRTLTGMVRGKTIGLLGVGSIGAHLASTAKHFGMTVHGFTRSSEGGSDVDRYFHDDLPAFAAGLDYLVCVLPNTPATRQIVDASVLAALPPQAVLINAGRGAALDEAALAEALSAGRIAAAVLDVFQQEPLPPGHTFWNTPNLFITSHTAAPSFPADIAAVFIENYTRYINGESLNYQVDFERGY
ncbi:MAG: D-2-hydroxyacid dehydrogenase [Bacteroidota bacterium]